MGSSSFFPVGSDVEVRSNEDGFKGAWFEATILRALPKYRRYQVVYFSLISDEVPPKPLVNYVHFSYVRPRPPRVPHTLSAAAGFQLHQLVEAFHNDGWWKGIVRGVPRGRSGRFSVCFPSSREEFEFKGEEMREQLEWVKGSWVAVQHQEGENVMFDMGRKVEVSVIKENYGVSWHAGTVLKVIGKSFFLVEYESRRVDDGGGSNGMRLKEIVDSQYIRPSPPPASKSEFKIFDEVEVFYLGGWLAGMIVEIRSRLRYIVKLKCREQEIELDQSAIRPHFDWINGHWVCISRDESSKAPVSKRPKSTGRRGKFRTIKSLPISSRSCSKNDGEVADSSDAVNLKGKNAEEQNHEREVNLLQPCRKLKKETLLKEHLKLVDGTQSAVRRQRSKVGRRSSLPDHALYSSSNKGKFGVVYSKSRKVEKLSFEDKAKSSQSSKNVTLIGCGATNLPVVGKTTPSLVDKQHHSSKRIALNQKVMTKSELVPSLKNLCHIKDISRENGIGKSITSEGVSSSCSGEGSKHQSNACNLGNLPTEQAANSPNADWGSCNKDNCSPNDNNNKMRRKKVVDRASYRLRRTSDIVDVKQAQEEEKKRKRGRPPKTDVKNGNRKVQRRIVIAPSPYKLRKTGDVVDMRQYDPKGKKVGKRGRPPKTGNLDQNKNNKVKKMKLAVQAAYELRRNSDVDVKQPAQEEKKRKRGRPPKKKITCTNGMESKQLKEGSELVVGCEDRNDLVELSKSIQTVNVSDSLLIANTENNSPVNNVTYICLLNKQADIEDDSPFTPPIESPTLVAQQLPILKSFNTRVEQYWTLPSRVNEVSDYNDPTLSGSPLEKVVEMVKSPSDPTPSDSSLSKDGKVSECNEFTPIDPIPVPNHDELTPSGSLSENAILEGDKAQTDCTSSGSSPSKDDIHELPSDRALILTERRAEIDPIKSGSISTAITLPFTKESVMWESVELMEIFRAMPQQPHFQTLQQYEVEFREGMAIGLMVTFANLVNSIQKLQITDPQDVYEEKLKALMPLEANGFNVDIVRSRLEKLLEIRSNASYAVGQKESLRERIMEREDEKVVVDSLIAAHDKVVSELEESIRHFQERRRSVLLERDNKNSEMVQLKMELQATEEAYLSAEELFNNAVYAPW